MSGTRGPASIILPPARQSSALILGIWGDVQHSLQELRLISTPRLHTLLCVHLVPINQIISLET